jgi:hypothetical protein
MKAQRKLVSFIGLGSSSASPLLYSYIKAHPKVCVPKEETHFFSDTKVFKQGVDWYESNFMECGEGFVFGELASNYLKNSQSISLIARTYPEAKLIVVIENPLVAVRVAYVEARRAKQVSPQVSLAMFLKQNPEVLTEARFGRQLAQYFSFYSPKDMIVVTAADVRNETLATLANIYEHIGVDKSFIPVNLLHLVPPDEDLVKIKPGIIKRTFRAIKALIVDAYKAIINKINPPKVVIETASVVARKVPLSPELEAYLINFYAADVALLSNLLHRDMAEEWEIKAN